MKVQFYYIDPQGKRWNLENVQESDLRGFYSADREDGIRVTVYRQDLKVEKIEP